MGIDFRPANYFGVTGINVLPGEGGQPLHDASLIKATPSGNFTLQALLSRANAISHTVLTPKVIDVIDRATRYTDGLEPLLETILIMSDSLGERPNRKYCTALDERHGNKRGISGLCAIGHPTW